MELILSQTFPEMTYPADTFISDFSLSELWKSKFLLF